MTLLRSRSRLKAALDLLEEYAPDDRQAAWHVYEECWLEDPAEWVIDRERTHGTWDVFAAMREDLGDHAGAAQFRAFAKRSAPLGRTPTDEDLCDSGCMYPRARALLGRFGR